MSMKEKNQPLFSKFLKTTYFIFYLYHLLLSILSILKKSYILVPHVLKVLFMMVDDFDVVYDFLIVVPKRGKVRIMIQNKFILFNL